MIKQINVTFEFDSDSGLVSNVHSFVDSVEQKKKTTRKLSKDKEEIIELEAIITREDNKIVFNNKAYNDLELSPESRVIIKYEEVGKKRFPIIGTDISFNEEGSGNKVTKTKTVSYRGKVNTILSEYGTNFKLEPYNDGIWKLVSSDLSEKTYEEVIDQAENLDVDILTTDDSTIEIDELTFKL